MKTRWTRALAAAVLLILLVGCRSTFWSPDSKSIALDVDGRLRIFSVATGKFTTLDTGGRYVAGPTFSPDGKLLAYYGISRRGNTLSSSDLYVRDLATQAERRLASGVTPLEGLQVQGEGASVVRQPGGDPAAELALATKMMFPLAWSPDSRRIAYTRATKESGWIEIVAAAGGQASRLAGMGENQLQAAWSPDGTRLLYVAQPGSMPGGQPHGALYVCDASGGNGRRLWADTPQATLSPFSPPTWSADGTQVVLFTMASQMRFEGTPGGDPAKAMEAAFAVDVRVLPAAGGQGRVLTRFPSPVGMLSPDLKAAVYLGGAEMTVASYSAAPFRAPKTLDRLPVQQQSPGGPRQGSGVVPFPVLSPDGKTVAVPVEDPRSRRKELRLYDVATGKKSVFPVQ